MAWAGRFRSWEVYSSRFGVLLHPGPRPAWGANQRLETA